MASWKWVIVQASLCKLRKLKNSGQVWAASETHAANFANIDSLPRASQSSMSQLYYSIEWTLSSRQSVFPVCPCPYYAHFTRHCQGDLRIPVPCQDIITCGKQESSYYSSRDCQRNALIFYSDFLYVYQASVHHKANFINYIFSFSIFLILQDSEAYKSKEKLSFPGLSNS